MNTLLPQSNLSVAAAHATRRRYNVEILQKDRLYKLCSYRSPVVGSTVATPSIAGSAVRRSHRTVT